MSKSLADREAEILRLNEELERKKNHALAEAQGTYANQEEKFRNLDERLKETGSPPASPRRGGKQAKQAPPSPNVRAAAAASQNRGAQGQGACVQDTQWKCVEHTFRVD